MGHGPILLVRSFSPLIIALLVWDKTLAVKVPMNTVPGYIFPYYLSPSPRRACASLWANKVTCGKT